MGSKGHMAKRMHALLAVFLCVALAAGLNPVAAFAAGAGVEGSTEFDKVTGQQTTSVYVKAHTELLHIIDHTKAATADDLVEGIWVQVSNGTAPFTTQWHSVQVDESGNAVEGTQLDWGAGEPFDEATSSFYLKSSAEKLDRDGKYHFWCEVTDSSDPAQKVSNEDDPIVVIASSAYGPGPKEWFDYVEGSDPKPEHWTWRVEGGMVDSSGADNGVDGKIANQTVLSASKLEAGSVAERLADEAAKADRRVDAAYNLALTNAPEGKDAFLGTLLAKLDVTDLLAADGAPSADKLGLLWMNPYEPGGEVVPIAAGEPYGLTVVTEDGRTYLTFRFPGGQAGPSGSFGTFAVTAPVPASEMHTISISKTEGGRVTPYGTIERAEGSKLQLSMTPEFGYKTEAVVAVDAQGRESDVPGSRLEGDTFIVERIEADLALRVKFAKVEVPQPGTEEAQRLVDLEVASADMDRQSSAYLVGYENSEVKAGDVKRGIQVDVSAPLILAFNTAKGFAADSVRVAYAVDDFVDYPVEGAYKELPVLTADATITVTYRPVVVDPVMQAYATSARALPERAADVAASSSTGDANTAVTFSAVPKIGWRLTGAQVVYTLKPQGAASEEMNGPSYGADELSSGSLTLYGIASDTRVDFTFEKITSSVIFPEAAGIPGVDSISASGARPVDVDAPIDFTITLKEGYTLPPSGLMLIGSEREGGLGWQGAPVVNADGTTTYTVRIAFADVADLGSGVKLSIMPKKGSGGAEQGERFTVTTSAGAGGTITASTSETAGGTVTIWFFPDDGKKLGQVLLDGAAIAAFDGPEEVYDHTGDAKPYVMLRGLAADHTVSAGFEDAPGTVNPPHVVIKPDPGDLPDNPDDPADPDRPPFGAGDTNVDGDTPVYTDEDQSFTYVVSAGFELDAVLVDGEYIYFDGAHLKDDPALGDHKLFSWDEESGCYVFKDAEGETVEFDLATGTLTFHNVQRPHTYLFVRTPVAEVAVNVDVTGGAVHANGVVEGGTKTFAWKTRKGLTLYMLPDVAKGYRLGDVKLDGAVVPASEIREAGDDFTHEQERPPLSQLVKALTLAAEAYAAEAEAEAPVYAYTIPSAYLAAKKPGEVVSITVPFVKDGGTSGDNQGGNQGGDNGNQGGNNQGGSNGNQGGNGSGAGTGTPGISNGFNGATQGDGSAQNPDGTFTVRAQVKSGQGALDCAPEQHVRPGANCTVAFKPAVGYQVAALHIDGTRYAYTNRTFTFQNVQAGHTVAVEFARIGYAGDNSQLPRTVKTLQSLAQTGDLNAPAATTLLAVAFGASGLAFLTWNRRRKQEERA